MSLVKQSCDPGTISRIPWGALPWRTKFSYIKTWLCQGHHHFHFQSHAMLYKKTFLTQRFMAFETDFSLANAFIQHFSGWSKGSLKLWSCHFHRYLNFWGQISKNKVGYEVLMGFGVTWPTQMNLFLHRSWSTVMYQQTNAEYFKSCPTKTEKS